MNAKNTISISEARKNIFEIADKAQVPDNYYILTENGKPKLVLLSFDQFESLMEDLEMMSDPKTLANIRKAESEIAKGQYINWEDLKTELGLSSYANAFMVADKPRKNKKKQTYQIKKIKSQKKLK
jgi:prevent-host-death family protein